MFKCVNCSWGGEYKELALIHGIKDVCPVCGDMVEEIVEEVKKPIIKVTEPIIHEPEILIPKKEFKFFKRGRK